MREPTPAARLFGHPLHPMLTAFPVAFWIGAGLWDLADAVAAGPLWPQLAAWTLVLGVVSALPALATGFWDLVRLPAGHPAEALAWWHGGTMATAWCLFLTSLLLRRDVLSAAGAAAGPSTLALTLSALGVGLVVIGGWLGGELVFGHGVAVRPAAADSETERKGC